jgi:two-component system response regulator YesN
VFSDLDSLKAAFVTKIDHITSLLGRLHYGTENNTMIDQVCKCVLENIDGDVSLRAVSDLIFMNKTYVSEAFKQKAGISFTEYLTIVKMERAKKLIADGRLKTYELAAMLGFRDIEYFSKLFKKHIGLSPTEYKQNALNKNK